MAGKSVQFTKQRVVKVGDQSVLLEVMGGITGPYHVSILDENGQATKKMDIGSDWWPGKPVWFGTVGGKDVAIQARPIANGMMLSYRGAQSPTYVYTAREAELAALMPVKVAADMSKYLLCPMPGLVKAIHVAEGQEVKAGDSLAVVEAMKMENILKAERDGKVKKVAAKAGDSLAVDAVILEFA
jgi:propionyl-CoA carboxylase alpha chain